MELKCCGVSEGLSQYLVTYPLFFLSKAEHFVQKEKKCNLALPKSFLSV